MILKLSPSALATNKDMTPDPTGYRWVTIKVPPYLSIYLSIYLPTSTVNSLTMIFNTFYRLILQGGDDSVGAADALVRSVIELGAKALSKWTNK